MYDHDDREGETDLVIASQFVTPHAIRAMRKDGGGLIFLMISNEIAQKLQLPFLADVYQTNTEKYPVMKALEPNDILYDTKSSFSLYINHRETFTGITDKDRSHTMHRFAELIKEIQENHLQPIQATTRFGTEFRSPGHIPICIAAPKLLDEREGHTELVVSLMIMAGLIPAGSGCEMMGDSGNALSKTEVKKYAKTHGLIFLTSQEVKDAWPNHIP